MHYRRWRVHGDTSITKKAGNGEGYQQNGYSGKQIGGVRTFDHVRIAEKALGKALPVGAVVHHVNEIKTDNRNENLVICPDRAYHNLIHARMAAIAATGDPEQRPCRHCKQYEILSNLRVYERGNTNSYWHVSCSRENAKQKYWSGK